MENVIIKLRNILSMVSEEEIKELEEAIDKAFSENKTELKVKLKSSWAKGYEDDPGNYLSIDFRIDK